MPDRKKRYFWLQLKEDFFDDDTMAYIEEQPNGTEYALIYLKMCLRSLKLDGYLKRVVGNTMIPYDIPTLAKLVNSNVDTVRVAMKLFESIGLVKVLDSGEIYMSQIEEMIGSETEAAKQKRIERAKKEVATLSHDSRQNVTQSKSKSKSNSLDLDTTATTKNIGRPLDDHVEKDDVAVGGYRKLVKIFEENSFGLVSPLVSQKISKELEDFMRAGSSVDDGVAIIGKGMEIAALNGANNISYVLSVTKKWYQHNLFTLKDVEAFEAQQTSKKRSYNKRQVVEPKLASVENKNEVTW